MPAVLPKKDTKEMKIAFLYSAYTDPQHLKRLIDVMPKGSESFIHIDAKSDICQFKAVVNGEHIHYLEQRYNVVWGSFRQTEYQIALIRAALQSGIVFDYLMTMSGMEYPIWSNRRIEAFLTEKRKANKELLQALCLTEQSKDQQRLYIRHWPYNNRPAKPGSLFSKYRVMMRKLMFALGRRKPLEFDADGHHYKLYKGSDWFAITPELGAFVLDRWDNSPQLRAYFEDSFTPSETAIHTIAFNSEEFFRNCIFNDGPYTRLVDLTPLTYIDYRPLVHILDESYMDTLLSSGKMLCRKVISGKSDLLMEQLDAHRAKEAQGYSMPNERSIS